MNSDFSSMPSVVAEGRRVINNIERAASLYLVKNIFSLILAVISITAAFSYPLTPSQLTLMSLLAIGIPSLILALEPNENLVQGKFLRNAILRALLRLSQTYSLSSLSCSSSRPSRSTTMRSPPSPRCW